MRFMFWVTRLFDRNVNGLRYLKEIYTFRTFKINRPFQMYFLVKKHEKFSAKLQIFKSLKSATINLTQRF